MDLAMTILYNQTGNPSFYQAGFYSLAGGVILGLLAVITGLLELTNVKAGDKKMLATILYHGFLNGSIILIYAIIAWKAWEVFPDPYLIGMKGIITRSILVISLFAGNYLGGQLIYKHHFGIEKQNI
jgi:uncharacterized membrane protein